MRFLLLSLVLLFVGCASEPSVPPGPGLSEFSVQAARYPAPDSTLDYFSQMDPEYHAYALLSRGEIEEARAILSDYLAYFEDTNVLAPTPAAPLVEDPEFAQGIVRLRWLLFGEKSATGYYDRLLPAVRSDDFVRTSICSVRHQTYREYADMAWVAAVGAMSRETNESTEAKSRADAYRECVFSQDVELAAAGRR